MFLLSVFGGGKYTRPQGQVQMFASEELGSVRHGKQSRGGHIFCTDSASAWLAIALQGRQEQTAWCMRLCLPRIFPAVLQAPDLFHCFNHPQQSHPSVS